MSIPKDYTERVYAGVLGKIIGVYLGRPFEGWTYDKIMAELGEINYYVHEKLNVPLVVTDDDIAGTFTFLRALPDYDNDPSLTPAQIGQTWLNYLIENRTILWWGGLGQSTEHTAYLRLKKGIAAPHSGSIATNGKVVAEQIGAQIFIDGWAMVCPGDPARAADFARRAGSVSHDGEAIYGAQVLAAMEAMAFVENDLNKLIDTAVTFIPKDSVIYRLVADLRDWHAKYPDWHTTRQEIVSHYGYDRYGGNCHMVPNHGLILLGMLYGENNFQKSLMITNTAGWDTDCNSGNIGCLMGIKNGLAGLEAGPDFRTPVADRMYLASAEGGRGISDAVIETYHIVNSGRALQNQPALSPKNGARFHFEMPGSLQGFQVEENIESKGTLQLENTSGNSSAGQRCLAFRYKGVSVGRTARGCTPTFIPNEALHMPGYSLFVCPTIYPGQVVKASLGADGKNLTPVTCRLYISIYGQDDQLEKISGPEKRLNPGDQHLFNWSIPDCGGSPIAEIGIELASDQRADGSLYMDYLTWEGAPNTIFTTPKRTGNTWQKAWVNGVDHLEFTSEPFRLIQDYGRGLAIQGSRDWKDYQVSADITPHMVTSAGLAGRVQGMQRYYALLLQAPGKVRVVKMLDGEIILGEKDLAWNFGQTYQLHLQMRGNHIQAFVDGNMLFDLQDSKRPLLDGGIALVCEEGRSGTQIVRVQPLG